MIEFGGLYKITWRCFFKQDIVENKHILIARYIK